MMGMYAKGLARRDDGRWEAKFRAGGVRRSVYGKTRREVVERMQEALAALDEGLIVTTAKDTVAVYLADWLRTIEPTIKPRAFERYEQHVRLHIVPNLGRIPLARLTPRHVQDTYTALLKKGLSPRTVRGARAVLHLALQDAMAWGLLRRNVVKATRAPRVPKYEAKTLTPQQTRRFLEATQGDRLESLYVLVTTLGMREGELLGLRWKDVDLKRARLSVAGNLQRTKKNGLQVEEVKTTSSSRLLSLTPAAVTALRTHHRRQAQEKLKAGPDWDPRGFVFATSTGGPLESSNFIRRHFKPLLAKAKLPDIRFHDLRHTVASMMLAERVNPKVVAEILGHRTIEVTLNTYSHLLPGLQEEAARIMQDLLFGPPKP